MKTKNHIRVTIVAIIALAFLHAFGSVDKISGGQWIEGERASYIDSGRTGIALS